MPSPNVLSFTQGWRSIAYIPRPWQGQGFLMVAVSCRRRDLVILKVRLMVSEQTEEVINPPPPDRALIPPSNPHLTERRAGNHPWLWRRLPPAHQGNRVQCHINKENYRFVRQEHFHLVITGLRSVNAPNPRCTWNKESSHPSAAHSNDGDYNTLNTVYTRSISQGALCHLQSHKTCRNVRI